MDGRLWMESGGVRHEIQLGVASRDLVEIPPAPPEDAPDLRAVIDGISYFEVPRGATAQLKASGGVSALAWQVSSGTWELLVNDRAVALTGGARQVGADDRLRVRSG